MSERSSTQKSPKRSKLRSIRDQNSSTHNNLGNISESGFTSDYYEAIDIKNRQKSQASIYEKSRDHTDDENYKTIFNKRVACSAIGYQININDFISELQSADIQVNNNINNISNNNMIIISFQDSKETNIYLFNYGIIIVWGLDESIESRIKSIYLKNCKYRLHEFQIKTNRTDLIEDQIDTNVYYYSKGETFNISKNKITGESNSIEERMIIAQALAQETILSFYESDIAKTIEATKRIPIDMRDKGEITMSKKEISRYIGLIFMQRSAINLNSDILDNENIHNEELRFAYKIIKKYFDTNKRLEILNRRSKLLKELYDVMNNEIKTQGKFRLEWIVVYLVVVEIFVAMFWKMLVKDILKLY